jgi:hypothetical protein
MWSFKPWSLNQDHHPLYGAGNAVLRLIANRRLVALATPPLFLEYEDVLKRRALVGVSDHFREHRKMV